MMESRRIIPPKELEEILDKLSSPGPTAPLSIFATKQKILMFAAALGWHLEKRTPLVKKGEGIRYDAFLNAVDDGFITNLAVASEESLKILDPDKSDERATIFEEYAHTGMLEIKKRCFEIEGDPMNNLIKLTDEVRDFDEDEMDGVKSSILKGLIG
jgi:dnd system-associated protein 4